MIFKFCDSICASEGNLEKVNMTTGYQRDYDFDKEITGHIPYEPTYSYHISSLMDWEMKDEKLKEILREWKDKYVA